MEQELDWNEYVKKERQAIDDIDCQVVQLLNQRARHAKAIGDLKNRNDSACYSPTREQEVLERIRSLNPGPLHPDSLQTIYREVMSACRSLERQHRVAYLGPEASFTQMACRKHFGSSVVMEPMPSIWDVFNHVERGEADFGVVPIENSTDGAVSHSLDSFIESSLKICAETYLPIHQCLLSCFPLERIEKVYSHPQGIGQCQKWLRENLPNAALHSVSSTSHGAELAQAEENSAAIGNRLAAEVYGLKILRERIEDNPNNRTRFLIIGNLDNPPTGKDKTSIVISVPHQPGALHDVLGELREHSINMTMIESRPTRVMPWEYLFFIDFQGHQYDESARGALDGLKPHCPFIKIVGSYPEAE